MSVVAALPVWSPTAPPLATAPESVGHLAFRAAGDVALDADYVVVGSGSGGSAAAVVLARAGFRVVVVEAGAWRAVADYPSTMLATMRDLMPDWGATVAVGASLMPVVQAQCVGGGTVINSAIMVRTPGDVVRHWRDDHGLGDLFTEQAMGDALDAVAAELAVAPTPRGPFFGRSGDLLLDALHARGIEGHPTARNVDGCLGSARCMQGCRHGAKRSSNLGWLPEVIARGGLVLSCAPVASVRIDGGVAVGVAGRFRHPRDRRRGAAFTVRARRGVVVAASAVQTPLLLARSGVRHPALGRFFRAHPGAAVIGVYDDIVDMERGATQGVASVHFRGGLGSGGEVGDGVGIKIESLALPLELVAGRTAGAGAGLVDKLVDARQQALWVAAVRAEAVGSCRPGLFGQPSLRYDPTLRDRVALQRAIRLLAELHFERGARRVRPGVFGLPSEIRADQLGMLGDADANPIANRDVTWVLSHLFGGAVIGADARHAVVGPDLAVRGVRRLHVACAALLPSTLGVNPQHTLMAVARIVAARLAEQPAP